MTSRPLWEPSIVAATVVANLIGGTVFFWVDRKIFNERRNEMVTKRPTGRRKVTGSGKASVYKRGKGLGIKRPVIRKGK